MSARTALAAAVVVALCVLPARPGSAHEARPAYLELTQTAADRWEVLWRTPVLSGMPLPVVLRLPERTRIVGTPARRTLPDSTVERFVLVADGDLAGSRIEFVGLEATITDVLVREQLLDGARATTLVRPSRPWIEPAATRGAFAVAGAYLVHGVEHILFGWDHLLFVFGLVLLVRSARVLVTTITAFTLAHSITLALATFGTVRLPSPPVEATIALSIVFLANELVWLGRGRVGPTARWPWVVAFGFGLLHGFGFAGALADLGLPPGDVPLALFAFNVGVELGQLAFIGALAAAAALARRLAPLASAEPFVRRVAPWAIGVVAAFWFFERLATFAARA